MATWKNATTDVALAQDPAITLKDYIENNYTIGTPAVATVRFDTKFARLDKPNNVIVEDIDTSVGHMVLGNVRQKEVIIKRIQIYCQGKGAINNRFLIQRHILDIINANPLGMQSDGIQWAFIEQFRKITMQTDSKTNIPEIESTDLSRSHAIVRMRFDNVLVP